MSIFSNAAPAVKKETRYIGICTLAGTVLMLAVFGVLHAFLPEKVPFDYRVVLGGICGGIIAVVNFFLMGLTVQNVAATEDKDAAARKMKTSYTYRMLLQLLWIIAAITAPCFFYIAGLVPLLFPGAAVKLRAFHKEQDIQNK